MRVNRCFFLGTQHEDGGAFWDNEVANPISDHSTFD
ncbi:hypothetical protein CBM2592_A280122 [Cupriavidus taiwanensis]|nr:hypothetical protein CBM2592_A280122 [Cupriavidus taiwanensis]SOY85777.1 hypothetical protein CBM2591_A320122 [Cupriavidus taiwanensis]SPA15652.1 hypothetical protein CBM2631_A320025 [Cupriavidus taiwanensis]SPD44892.1 protein of unknown function [Cupriavidus taiwanensis]